MHHSVQAVLSGIEACRRYLLAHPAQPVKAVNRRFDYTESTAGPHAVFSYGPGRWVELRPLTFGIAIQLAHGPLRMTAASVPYPMMPGCAVDEPYPDPAAIVSTPFLEALAVAVDRALEQLARLPEPIHV